MATTDLIVEPAYPWPRGSGWLVPGVNCTWLEYLIVKRTERDDGILEQPWAPNKGTRIDAMQKRWKLKGEWWCAIWVGAVYADCGALVPRWAPKTESWLPYLERTPRPGWAPVYGYRDKYGPDQHDSVHIGIATRIAAGIPKRNADIDVLTREGNRALGGTASNNGVAVDQGPMNRTDLLGYFPPLPVPGWTLAQYAPSEFLVEHWASIPKPERPAAMLKIKATLGLALSAT